MCDLDSDPEIEIDKIKLLPTPEEVGDFVGEKVYGTARRLDTLIPLAGIVPLIQDKLKEKLEKLL